MKHKSFIILSISVLLLFSNFLQKAYSQSCGTSEIYNAQKKGNPRLEEVEKLFFQSVYATEDNSSKNNSSKNKFTEKSLQKNNLQSAETRIIPVVFHVVHTYGAENISKERILDNLQVLNEDFRKLNKDADKIRNVFKDAHADCEIEFRLARRDPQGNCTDGIERIYSPFTDDAVNRIRVETAWDIKRYLNVWIVKTVNGGRNSGFANFPWNNNDSLDGVVVDFNYIGKKGNCIAEGRVLTHEVGHWLGLLHTFENGCGKDCRTTGDNVCDTPPQAEGKAPCGENSNSCDNDSPDLPDQSENYMSYSLDCQAMFTNGQKAIMDKTLSGTRKKIISPENLIFTGIADSTSICKPKSDFFSKIRMICKGDTLRINATPYRSIPNKVEWITPGGTQVSSNNQEIRVIYNNVGQFPVSLVVSNTAGADTLTRESYVLVVDNNIATTKTPYKKTDLFKEIYQPLGQSMWLSSKLGYNDSGSFYIPIDGQTGVGVNSFFLPPLDFTTVPEGYLKLRFYVAHAPNKSKNDQLNISVLRNCGETQELIANLSGDGLHSVSDDIEGFKPRNNADWREITIDLKKYSKDKNVVLKFDAVGDGGNSIFIDDISVGLMPTSVETEGSFIKKIQLSNK